MKKITTILALLFFIQVNAQTINSISIYPQNPTTNDSILILAECMFTSGSCAVYTQGHSITGNSINAWAFHCLGMLAVICTDTDTFAVGMLPAGTYTLNFQLDEGHGGPPCTPGIVPGPSANATFTVSTPTFVSEAEFMNNSLYVYPNPGGNQLIIDNGQLEIKSIEIYNVLGQSSTYGISQLQTSNNKPQTTIDISELTPGIYFVKVITGKTQQVIKVLKK